MEVANTLAYYYTATITAVKSFIVQAPGANVIKHFTLVIYCRSIVIPSLCIIKMHYLGNYCGMAVNYQGMCVTNVIKHNLSLNVSNTPRYSNPEKKG